MVSNRDLPEDEFITEKYGKNPFPFWLWFFVVVAVGAVTWGSFSWWSKERNVEISGKPFLQVTNREFSLFLWQFPQYMRINTPNKTGYLPAFQLEGGIGLIPEEADSYVQVSEEVLFMYHTWKRLLKSDYIPRAIPVAQFKRFLKETEVWEPKNWTEAPDAYKRLIAKLEDSSNQTLDGASRTELPLDVRIAFQGWRNFFVEGKAVASVAPTYEEMAAFLTAYPHYRRHYWRNIVLDTRPDYLKTFSRGNYDPSAVIDDRELDGFLKVAFFNFTKARQGK